MAVLPTFDFGTGYPEDAWLTALCKEARDTFLHLRNEIWMKRYLCADKFGKLFEIYRTCVNFDEKGSEAVIWLKKKFLDLQALNPNFTIEKVDEYLHDFLNEIRRETCYHI